MIYRDRVEFENAAVPHGEGPLKPDNFTPFPKNPVLSKFFIQLGRAEELGSGILNVNRLIRHYAPGKEPQFLEGTVFKTIVPIPQSGYIPQVTEQVAKQVPDGVLSNAVNDAVSDTVSDAVNKRLIAELIFIVGHDGIRLSDIKRQFGVERATGQRDMQVLKKAGLVLFQGSPKTGRYILTAGMAKRLKRKNENKEEVKRVTP